MDLENKFSYHFLEGLTLTKMEFLLKEMSKFIFHRKS